MDRRLWPSTFPATSIRPASSGPLWATRASMREAVSGSMPPYPPTIPHMSLHSTPGSGTLATVDVTPGRKGCRCYSRTGTFRPYPLIFSHLADLARARVGLKWLYLYCEPCHGIMRRGGGYGGGHSGGLPRWRGAGWRATRRLCRGGTESEPEARRPGGQPPPSRERDSGGPGPRTFAALRGLARAQASPGSLGSTSPTVSPKEFL